MPDSCLVSSDSTLTARSSRLEQSHRYRSHAISYFSIPALADGVARHDPAPLLPQWHNEALQPDVIPPVSILRGESANVIPGGQARGLVLTRIEWRSARPRRAPLDEVEERLLEALLYEPVEDGVTHSGEWLLEEAVEQHGPEQVCDWVTTVLSAEEVRRRGLAPAIVRIVARNPGLCSGELRRRLVERALSEEDVEMRDAGVQAAETWGDRELVAALRGHAEPVGWLREYIDKVITDLEV